MTIRCLNHQLDGGGATLKIFDGTNTWLANLSANVIGNLAPSLPQDQWLSLLTAVQREIDYALQQAQGVVVSAPTYTDLTQPTET